jgi:phosphinothricin acetyltransferase
MELNFEYAHQSDLETIVNIYNQAIPGRMSTADLDPVSIKSKQVWFDNFNHKERPIWVIKVDGKIAGWVSLEYFYGRPAYIHTAEVSIYIDNNYKHQGLGTSAIEFVIGHLKNCR